MNDNNYNGNTPIIEASRYGHQSIVELFISKGANVNDKDNDGNTPIILACCRKYASVIKLLLLWGANPEEMSLEYKNRYKWPWTMLMYCLQAREIHIPCDVVDMLGDIISYKNIDDDYDDYSDDDFDFT